MKSSICYIFGVDDVLVGSAISGGASLLGGFMSNNAAMERQEQAQMFNARESAQAREFNAQEAKFQRNWAHDEADLQRGWSSDQAAQLRDWQERMSNSAYQRSMQDMKNAGLNPILAYAKGGASTPPGAMGSASAPSGSAANGPAASSPAPPAAHDFVTPALNTALAVGRGVQEVQNMKEVNKNLQEDNRVKQTEWMKNIADANRTYADQKRVETETDREKARMPIHSAEAAKYKIDHGVWDTPYGRLMRQFGTMGEEAQRGSSAASNFMNPIKTFNQLWKDRTDRGF